MSTDIKSTGQPLDLDKVRDVLDHYLVRMRHCPNDGKCMTCRTAAAETARWMPVVLAEIEWLNGRLNDRHEALTRVEDDDPDEFVSLESTVEWVVNHYRALRKDFDELDALHHGGAS